MGDHHWLSEAIVDYLRGPLYINPLMSFIDDRCLLFTPEEENKLEYTQVHEEFKQLVDRLLTEFLSELGISPDTFYEIVSSEHNKDKLTEFVVRTILTVDDFLMFKAMMVKRNIDLTNQVLAAMEQVQRAAGMGSMANYTEPKPGASRAELEEEARLLQEAMAVSQSTQEREAQWQALQALMRRLQIEDEDPALAIAIANSLKGMNQVDQELADLEQAIALSLALEAEQRRQQEGGAAGAGGSGAAAAAAGIKGAAGAAAARGAETLQHRPFDAAGSAGTKTSGAMGDTSQRSGGGRGPVHVDPLDPLNIGPNTAAEQMAAIAARAQASAQALGAQKAAVGSSGGGGLGGVLKELSASGKERSGGGAEGQGKFQPAVLNLPDVKRPPGGGSPPANSSGRFVPQPLNLDRPKTGKPSQDDVLGDDSGMMMGGMFGGKHAILNRPAGYKSDGVSLDAAIAQKDQLMARRAAAIGAGGGDDSAQKWLTEQKLKLVASKQAERQAEMDAYKADKGPSGSKGAAPDNLEAKRAALRDKLAAKFKQDLVQQSLDGSK